MQIELIRFVDLDDLLAAGTHAVVEELSVFLVATLNLILSGVVRLPFQDVLLLLERLDFIDPVVHLKPLFGSESVEVDLWMLPLPMSVLDARLIKNAVDLALDRLVGRPWVPQLLKLRVALMLPQLSLPEVRVCDEHALAFFHLIYLVDQVFKLVGLLEVLFVQLVQVLQNQVDCLLFLEHVQP